MANTKKPKHTAKKDKQLTATLLVGDVLKRLRSLPDNSVHTCVTSPPYFGLRDYGMSGQIGLETTPDAYVEKLVRVFREVRRVLREDGTLWLNIGDSYASTQTVNACKKAAKSTCQTQSTALKSKDIIGIPWRLAFALQADGWYLRQDIIWHKPNPLPESVRDRCTKSHEYIFLLSKSPRYHFDHEAIKEKAVYANCNRPSMKKGSFKDKGEPLPGQLSFRAITDMRNKRSVWSVATKPFKGAHFATFPEALVVPCILAASRTRRKSCDCSEMIKTPMSTGGAILDNSKIIGRAGTARTRKQGEGVRQITRRQQRSDAQQLRVSKHKEKIKELCGSAFSHYIRMDKAGARPLPASIREKLLRRGWLTEATKCACGYEDASTVLDPFSGAATTGVVALKLGRNYIGCELNPEYVEISKNRIMSANIEGASVVVRRFKKKTKATTKTKKTKAKKRK